MRVYARDVNAILAPIDRNCKSVAQASHGHRAAAPPDFHGKLHLVGPFYAGLGTPARPPIDGRTRALLHLRVP